MSRFGDREIKAFFEEARRVDRAATPPLKRVLERSRAARASLWRTIGTALAAAAILTMVLVVRWTGTSQPAARIELSEWRSPTEFLLRPALADLAPALDGEAYPSTALRSIDWSAAAESPQRPKQEANQ